MRLRPSAVVLGLGVNGLSVVRALGTRGVAVVGVYRRLDEVGRWSRYCRAVRFPPLEANRAEFLECLLGLGRSENRPVLIPTSDEYLQFVSDYREQLGPAFRLALPDAKILEMLLRKHGTRELAQAHGVCIPETRFPVSVADIESLCTDLQFPCLIKPLDTFSVAFPDGAKNTVVSNPVQLRTFYATHPRCLGQTVVQEVIRGGDGFIFVYAAYCDARSEVLAEYTGRKIRQYPPDYGITCLGESVWIPELAAMTAAFLKHIRYRGIVGVEYARDRRSGAFYLLELNARSSYYNQLPTDCGVNLAYVAYRDLVGDPVRCGRQRDGVRWLDFQHDLSTCWWRRGRGELTWRAWLSTIAAARSFAYFDRRDAKPFLASVARFGAVLATKALAPAGRGGVA